MKVKCFVVTNKEAFLNQLVTELIAQGIDYVQIGNEFHFNNQIYRFYSPEEVPRKRKEPNNFGIEIIEVNHLDDHGKKKLKKGNLSSQKVPTYNKTLIKKQNRSTNKYLKGNIR